jgi:hypothetical protein
MAPCPGLTISTVGYGDHYPVTNAGRIIGTCVIVVGVGIFGTFTGYLANVFLGPAKRSGTAGGDGDAARPIDCALSSHGRSRRQPSCADSSPT